MSTVDLTLTLLVVAVAIGFLVKNVASGKKPACHPPSSTEEAPQVVLGASLARGLEKARARR